MITSLLFGVCFIVLLTKRDNDIRLMAILCLSHMLIENGIYWYFWNHPEIFDLSFYLTVCWSLDSTLLFGIACVLSGAKKKAIAASAIPFLLLQVFVIQYPDLFPSSWYTFTWSQSSSMFMESLICVCALKDTSIREWVQLCIIGFCLLTVHLLLY